MAKLIYSAITSLDGYMNDRDGRFDWAAPDEEVHAYVNELERSIGTYLYGRKMYEVMAYWENAHAKSGQPGVEQEYAKVWQAADKIVYSRTLSKVTTAKTRLEHAFDADAVRRLKFEARRDISVGGSELAAAAIKADLVDECHLFLHAIVVGGGKRALPEGVNWKLSLVNSHHFASGVVHLHYRSAR